ncbi:hypothetical protein DdX_21944 [Ditylenchus destructor]|uniref:Uncharacterized protein n=1 Tax=Ditylenchus destructor TaxID=166010 RepID=A0AAD4QV38_9BILA|nr:hypothetical protein DdX_21944 [Ditylenchus destructor]
MLTQRPPAGRRTPGSVPAYSARGSGKARRPPPSPPRSRAPVRIAALTDGQVVIGHAVPFGQAAQSVMVGNHRDDLRRQRSRLLAVEQVVQAVRPLRHRDHQARLLVDADSPQSSSNSAATGRNAETSASRPSGKPGPPAVKTTRMKKAPRLQIGILLAVQDEAVVPRQEPGHARDDPHPVDAGEGEDPARLVHAGIRSWRTPCSRPDRGDTPGTAFRTRPREYPADPRSRCRHGPAPRRATHRRPLARSRQSRRCRHWRGMGLAVDRVAQHEDAAIMHVEGAPLGIGATRRAPSAPSVAS